MRTCVRSNLYYEIHLLRDLCRVLRQLSLLLVVTVITRHSV